MKRHMYDRAVKEITLNNRVYSKPAKYDPYRELIESKIQEEGSVKTNNKHYNRNTKADAQTVEDEVMRDYMKIN